MKPLSNDLRERFVHAVLVEGMTCRAAGKRFAVSHSAVIKIVRQFIETVLLAPPQALGGAGGKLLAASNSAVIKIVRQFIETGFLDPQKVGGSRKPILSQCYDMVRAIVEETPGLTLAQITDAIVARGGPKVGKSSVDRTLTRLDLRFKKKFDRRRADAH